MQRMSLRPSFSQSNRITTSLVGGRWLGDIKQLLLVSLLHYVRSLQNSSPSCPIIKGITVLVICNFCDFNFDIYFGGGRDFNIIDLCIYFDLGHHMK